MREKFDTFLLMFTRLSTQFCLVDALAHLIFKGVKTKVYSLEFLVILGIASICAVLYVALLINKNVSKKTMLLLQFCYFVIVDTAVIISGYLLEWFSFTRIYEFITFESFILLLIVITILHSYKTNSAVARKMNEKLKELEQKNG